MPVGVQSDARGRVPELRLNGLHAGALGDQQRRAGVPQVVKAQPLGQPAVRTAGLKKLFTHVCGRSGPPNGAVNTSASGPCGCTAR